MPLRVAVVDDHPMFRSGIISTLSRADNVEIVGDGASAADALELAAKARPDVMLLDIGLPGGGLNALRAIKREKELPISIIMISVSERTDDVISAMDGGAAGYLVKGILQADLVHAVKLAREGGIIVDDNFAIRIVHGARMAPTDSRSISRLTRLEQRVHDCLIQGMSNAEVARAIDSTPKAVRRVNARIASKLGIMERLFPALKVHKSRIDGDVKQGAGRR